MKLNLEILTQHKLNFASAIAEATVTQTISKHRTQDNRRFSQFSVNQTRGKETQTQ